MSSLVLCQICLLILFANMLRHQLAAGGPCDMDRVSHFLRQTVFPQEIPHPGDLRHKIDIGVTTNVVNENGYPVETDSVLHHVWAGVEDESSRWFHAADADNAERGLIFIIRFLPDIAPGMWILWNGEKQLITKIGEYDFKRRYMKLMTVSAKGVN